MTARATIAYRSARSMSRDRTQAIAHANAIITAYEAQGFTLTLRQLYYQFVARGILPNSQKSYAWLGKVLNDGRMLGMVSWLALEDRTRYLRSTSTWESPASVIRAAADGYTRDWWDGQLTRVEVWIEKDALVGVIEPICDRWQVPYFSCRGYTSQSEMWRAGMRFAARMRQAEPVETLVLHFGDHDPSGIDMSRDIEDRLRLFMASYEHGFELRRLALNMAQVERYDPPPNPAKLTDSRAQDYMRKFGRESWELDALEPTVIAALIETELDTVIDYDLMNAIKAEEATERAQLRRVSDNWLAHVNLAKKGRKS